MNFFLQKKILIGFGKFFNNINSLFFLNYMSLTITAINVFKEFLTLAILLLQLLIASYTFFKIIKEKNVSIKTILDLIKNINNFKKNGK